MASLQVKLGHNLQQCNYDITFHPHMQNHFTVYYAYFLVVSNTHFMENCKALELLHLHAFLTYQKQKWIFFPS